MTLSLDPYQCQRLGRRVLVSMDLFDGDIDGHGVVIMAEPGAEYADEVQKAIASWPEQAITLT